MQQLKLGFIGTIKWNRYQLKVTVQEQKQYLDFLNDTGFQGVNPANISTSDQRCFNIVEQC